MGSWLWLGTNVVVGIPLALATLVVARELIRSLVALVFGFQVFEIRLGGGPRWLERTLGPVDLVVSPIPLAGATIARSGIPRRHRLARIAVALAPALLQLCWLAFRVPHAPSPSETLSAGLAPVAALDLANAFLLVFHLALPVRLSAGVRTDSRLLFDILWVHANSNRMSRASYYARLARHRIDRADIAGAEEALEQGLVQLGREPILVACERCFRESELTSVIDQGACADGLQRLIEAGEADQDLEYACWSFPRRIARASAMAAPALVISISLFASVAPRLAHQIESSWLSESEEVVADGDGRRCASLARDWAGWAHRVDPWLPPDPSERSDRHFAFARLERCRGNLASAEEHRGEALLAANAARSDLARAMFAQPKRWFENELRVTQLFRHAAAVESDRRSFRLALAAITNAERRLDTVRRQVGIWPDLEARRQAETTLAVERAELVAMRERVMAGLSAH